MRSFITKIKLVIKDAAYEERWQKIARILGRLDLPRDARHLDIGCGPGAGTRMNSEAMGVSLENTFGIDIHAGYVREAMQSFHAARVDLESEKLPYPDQYFDIIVIDQMLEHLKNIDHALNEMFRVLKFRGYLLISVPNLAAWHNRLLLLLGRQPLCINIPSDHIRGFTFPILNKMLRLKGFTIVHRAGAGFYPLWGGIAKMAARLFPRFTVYSIMLHRKIAASLPNNNLLQTPDEHTSCE